MPQAPGVCRAHPPAFTFVPSIRALHQVLPPTSGGPDLRVPIRLSWQCPWYQRVEAVKTPLTKWVSTACADPRGPALLWCTSLILPAAGGMVSLAHLSTSDSAFPHSGLSSASVSSGADCSPSYSRTHFPGGTECIPALWCDGVTG